VCDATASGCRAGDFRLALHLYSAAMRACQRDATGASRRQHMALLLSNRAAVHHALGKHLEVGYISTMQSYLPSDAHPNQCLSARSANLALDDSCKAFVLLRDDTLVNLMRRREKTKPPTSVRLTGAAGLRQGDGAMAALVKAVLPDGERTPSAQQLGRRDAGLQDR
jgi:hypothetical protein